MKIISCDHDVMYLKLYIDEMDKCNIFFTEITWKASLFVGCCGMVEQQHIIGVTREILIQIWLSMCLQMTWHTTKRSLATSRHSSDYGSNKILHILATFSLQRHHNECNGVWNYWCLDCLLSRLFRCRSSLGNWYHATNTCSLRIRAFRGAMPHHSHVISIYSKTVDLVFVCLYTYRGPLITLMRFLPWNSYVLAVVANIWSRIVL